MKIIKDGIYYVGVKDEQIDLFEGQYSVPDGISYNSYLLLDAKVAVMDTVDAFFGEEWLNNIAEVLGERTPDYLIVQHMEPDHSANVKAFLERYPTAAVVGNEKTFAMINAFFGEVVTNKVVVKDGETLSIGKRSLTFAFAPMVHWPEVMLTYEATSGVLFSADAFGTFGADYGEKIDLEKWKSEGRRYYIGIVGKYGAQVQRVLQKAAALDIKTICPLHGPVLEENLGFFIGLYDKWSRYEAENEDVLIAYTSVYGNTKKAVELLAEEIKKAGGSVTVRDLARDDISLAVAEAFEKKKIIFATTTYNADIFPFMRTFIEALVERNFKNRRVGFIENGSWAPMAAKIMRGMLEKREGLSFCEQTVTVRSALNAANEKEIALLAKQLLES